MLDNELITQATHVLETLRRLEMQLATVESCTGGLIAATMTEIAGSSDVFERGFVTYSNEAKIDLLGIDPTLIALHGAVSREVALAMAIGGLDFSNADIAVSVTGIAGPGGGTPDKPVGLVHLATAGPGHTPMHQELRLGDIGRSEIRRLTVTAALDLILAAIDTDGTAEIEHGTEHL